LSIGADFEDQEAGLVLVVVFHLQFFHFDGGKGWVGLILQIRRLEQREGEILDANDYPFMLLAQIHLFLSQMQPTSVGISN
jgi:hypothetical protein